MNKKLSFPFCTNFSFDDETNLLELVSLFGMSCGAADPEKHYANSGLAVICSGNKRGEGRKLRYDIIESTDNSLAFNIFDENDKTCLECRWTFIKEREIISCRYTLVNLGKENSVIRRALPRFAFAPGRYKLHYQESRWLEESQPRQTELAGANIVLHAAPARSSVGNTPFCVLEDMDNSAAAAFHVIPRGNWCIKVNPVILKNCAPMPVIELGLSDNDLFAELAPGAKIELPEILICAVPNADLGLAGANLHRYIIDSRLPENLHTPPVLYNSWLYRFTNFTREQLKEQLAAAKKIGCEVFVVDAGWFGGDDWFLSAGNWQEKQGAPFYGNMASFADEVRASGLDFGFWLEPERWAQSIPIRQEHPEWFPPDSLRIDLEQPAAAEYFIDTIRKNVKKFGAKYIKLDFNADMGYDQSGYELANYCSKLAELLKELRQEFPDLVIENCGSGSLRNDLATAMLYDAAFISDHAHLYENLKIRSGLFTRTLPGRTLNWVVTRPAPERVTKTHNRELVLGCTGASWDEAALFNVNFIMSSALLGIPGFTGNLADMPDSVLDLYSKYIAFYKENRKFFIDSHVWQLNFKYSEMAENENIMAFQMQGKDCDTSLVFAFSNAITRRDSRRFKLYGLDPHKNYQVKLLFGENENTTLQTGADLMKYGINCTFDACNFMRHSGVIYQVKAE